MKLKRISCTLLAAGMVLTSVPCENVPYMGVVINAFADETSQYTVGNVTYRYVVNGDTCSITGFEGSDPDIVIPDMIDDKSVISIGYAAFKNCTTLVSVEVPQGVTLIGDEAFQGCTSLISIKIPDSVTNMEDDTFFNCPEDMVMYGVKGSYAETYAAKEEIKFKDLDIDDKIYVVNNSTYVYSKYEDHCVITGYSGSDTEIDIPAAIDEIPVTQIENEVFKGLTGITSVTIPSKITSIGDSAFADCTSLKVVNMQTELATIGAYAFSGCSALTTISFPNSMTAIPDYAFYNCSSLETINITNSIKTIGKYAFAGCGNISKITGGTKVVTISDYAFRDCVGLTDADFIYNTKLRTISEGAFAGCVGITEIKLGYVTSIGSGVFKGCTGLESISIESGNSSYCSCYAGNGNYEKQNESDPDDWNAIVETGSNILLAGCSNSFIPSGVTKIDNYAFQGSVRMESIEIPDTVTVIGTYSFNGCTALKSITIPASVITLYGKNVFAGCTDLVIYGYAGSRAETFAGLESITFREIGVEYDKELSVDGVKYVYTKYADHCEITGYSGEATDITIPETIVHKLRVFDKC